MRGSPLCCPAALQLLGMSAAAAAAHAALCVNATSTGAAVKGTTIRLSTSAGRAINHRKLAGTHTMQAKPAAPLAHRLAGWQQVACVTRQ